MTAPTADVFEGLAHVSPQDVWMAWLLLLLLVVAAMCRSAPRCPSCGSMAVAKHFRALPRVRQCGACYQVYEVRG